MRLIRFPRWLPAPFNPRVKLSGLALKLLAIGAIQGGVPLGSKKVI